METTTFAIIDSSDTILEVHELTDPQRDELVRRHGDRLVWLPMGGAPCDRVEVDEDGEAHVVDDPEVAAEAEAQRWVDEGELAANPPMPGDSNRW